MPSKNAQARPATDLPAHLGGQARGNVDLGIIRALQRDLGIATLVDIGCGDGCATLQYAGLGIGVTGVDGDWTRLPADPRFVCHDFTQGPVGLGGFDLAYSVEFLEHVEPRFLGNVMPLFAGCRYAVVTAAPPGQKGHHHVNCRLPDYWKAVFRGHGLEFDPDYTARLKRESTFCKATGPNKGKRIRFFERTGMFFRRA